jgi:hypothetical protein
MRRLLAVLANAPLVAESMRREAQHLGGIVERFKAES